jgi:hypothetical protein
VAHSAEQNSLQWPIARKDLRSGFLGEFESIFETALDHKSDDQLGTFGEITLDKKSHVTVL